MGTEQSIVHAALECLSASSIDKLTVRDIAARAGVNVATVHYYFRTKEGVISAALREFFAPVMQKFSVALALDVPPREKLLAFLIAYTDNFQAHPGVFHSLIAAISSSGASDRPSGPDPAERVLLEVMAAAKHHLLGLIRDVSGVTDQQGLVFLTLRTMTSVLHPLLMSPLPQTVLGIDLRQPQVRRHYLEGVVDSLDARAAPHTL